MSTRMSLILMLVLVLLVPGATYVGALVTLDVSQAAGARPPVLVDDSGLAYRDLEAQRALVERHRVSQEQKEAAARRFNALYYADNGGEPVRSPLLGPPVVPPMPQDGQPHYFGPYANWAFSPPLEKFVDDLPGLTPAGASQTLQHYISVANPDMHTYPGSDYYELALEEYDHKFHRDLPPTRMRGYIQTNSGMNEDGTNVIAPDPNHCYLGPIIVATKDRPVRVKFTNLLPTGPAGDLPVPVDTTILGAGQFLFEDGTSAMAPDNRATLHLHGGKNAWISDGTPHQWIAPADEDPRFAHGGSMALVPDMPDPGPGSQTFIWSNQQSARLLFYHDHASGITRLNVYCGEAAGYVLTDHVEQALMAPGGPLENLGIGIPLIIQDKSFVDPTTVLQTDPTWKWGTGPFDPNYPAGTVRVPRLGDLWLFHVYMPVQNPWDLSGYNAFGRWHYGPWFWPPVVVPYGPVPNPYYDPINAPTEPPMIPGTPDVSTGAEMFCDTAVVNGVAFPTKTLKPQAYRFRILNACNDRFMNLQLYVADPTYAPGEPGYLKEVKMVPAVAHPEDPNWPDTWPTDGREMGCPDWTLRGPTWLQLGNEAGFLPRPVEVPVQAITWNLDPTTFTMGNVDLHSLLLAPAERADVIVDFSAFAGQTLILYNDAPAAFPALTPQFDYYTNSPDLTDTGGYWGTLPGFGPNTRTVMQFVIEGTPEYTFDPAPLLAAFNPTDGSPGVFVRSQEPIIVGQAAYNNIYPNGAGGYVTFGPLEGLAHIFDIFFTTFRTYLGTTYVGPLNFGLKGIHDEMGAAFDPDYGRMSGSLGLEKWPPSSQNQNFVLFPYINPPTEVIWDCQPMSPPTPGDGTQIWKITHNGVDTHPIHFHLFDIQLLNRVAWDGQMFFPDENELGWKETLRVSPLMDTIVALRPIAAKHTFGIPHSLRLPNPADAPGSMMGFVQLDEGGEPLPPGQEITNDLANYGWEYVWHCHILSHEEMDMMRPIVFNVPLALAQAPVLTATQDPVTGVVSMTWTDATPPGDPATLGNPANEVGFQVWRAAGGAPYQLIHSALANATAFTDTTAALGSAYLYRVDAYNAAGFTSSNVQQFGPAMPAPPSDLAAVMVGPPLGVALTWTDNSPDEFAFHVQRASDAGFTANVVTLPATTLPALTDNTVAVGSTYYYRVQAENAQGLSDWSNTATIAVVGPAAPTGLTATNSVASTDPPFVTLNWVDNATNEAGFTVQRALNAAFTNSLVTVDLVGVNLASYVDNTVNENTRYYWRVRSKNAAGNSGWSNTVTLITVRRLPLAPTNLVTASKTRTRITITWQDNSNNEQGFRIERSTDGGATFVEIATRAANTTTYANTGLTPNTTYVYRVRAYNQAGNSGYTDPLTETTLP